MSDAAFSTHFHGQSTIECTACGNDVDVTWFCKNCPASLCQVCKEEHPKNRLLKNHEIVPRTGSVLRTHGPWKLSLSCRVHHGREVTTYCLDCKKPCCSLCLDDHQRHMITAIEKIYQEHEKRLNDFIKDLEKQTFSSLNTQIENLKEKQKSNKDFYIGVKDNINSYRKKLKDTVDKTCDNLVQYVDEIQSEYNLKMDEAIKHGERNLKELDELIAKCKMKIRAGGLEIMEYNPRAPQSYVLTCPGPKLVAFVPEQCAIDMLSKKLGKLEVTDYPLWYTLPPPSVLPHVEEHLVSEFKIKMRGGSVVPTNDDKVWVSNSSSGHDTMHLYDAYGKMHESFIVQKGSEIWDMVLKKSGDMIVANRDNKVRLVTKTGHVTTLIATHPFAPQGMCLTDTEEIVVCMADQGVKNHVAIFTWDGKRAVCEIEAKDNQNKELFTDPMRVVHGAGYITVLNRSQNVVTVDLQGKMKWVYDGSEAKGDKAFEPFGLCKDKFDNVMISDLLNHRVHYVNSEGCLLQIMMSCNHGIEYPWGIGVDDVNGRVWLGSSIHRKIWIAKYL